MGSFGRRLHSLHECDSFLYGQNSALGLHRARQANEQTASDVAILDVWPRCRYRQPQKVPPTPAKTTVWPHHAGVGGQPCGLLVAKRRVRPLLHGDKQSSRTNQSARLAVWPQMSTTSTFNVKKTYGQSVSLATPASPARGGDDMFAKSVSNLERAVTARCRSTLFMSVRVHVHLADKFDSTDHPKCARFNQPVSRQPTTTR